MVPTSCDNGNGQPVEHCGIYVIRWWKMSIMCVS